MRECRCSRVARDGYLCGVCVASLAGLLSRVPGMLGDLRVTAARLDRVVVAGPRVVGSSERPSPVNFNAVRAAKQLAKVVGHWRPRQARYIGGQPWGPAYLEELQEAMNEASAVIDLPQDWIHLGACGNIVDGIPCPQELFIPEGDSSVHCDVCGHYWDVRRRRAAAISSAWDVLAPARTVVGALASQGVRITPKHLENWAMLGHVTPLCDIATKRVVYRVADVHAVALRMEARRRDKRAVS